MFTRKDLAKLLLPLIVEQLLAVLVGMADVVMVAAVGETAVSGVSLVDSISILIIQMLAALATGGSVVCAQYIGKKQPENACEAAGQLILVTTMVSVVIAVIAVLAVVVCLLLPKLTKKKSDETTAQGEDTTPSTDEEATGQSANEDTDADSSDEHSSDN